MADNSTQSSSLSAFISTLIVTLITSVVFVIVFVTLRKVQRRVYEPRTLVETVPTDLKPDDTPKGLFSWATHLSKKPALFIIQQAGPDGYLFLRYLFEFGIVCVAGAVITWPILFPINASNSNHHTGFDTLSFGNVRNKWRYFAHIFLSWIFFGMVTFLIYREIVYYITFRHALHTTPLYDSLLSSRTLMLTELPENAVEELQLREYFPTATNVWIARNYKKLQKLVKERTKLANKYEGTANKVVTKAVKMRAKALKKNKPAPEPADDINAYLKDGKKRPTHRLKFLIGKKVDTLDYAKEHIGELNKEIGDLQTNKKDFDKVNSAFIEFPTQLELQKALQAIPYHPDFKKTRALTGVAPDDIVWENLSLSTYARYVKKILANAFLTVLIIFWAIPVAVVGAISNINFLISKVHFLKFINNLPSFLLGLITGLLPVIALAVLMSLVPPIIRKAGKISGCLTVQQVESYCQTWYFAFQVVQVFLVVTFGSAATSVVTALIDDPTSALRLLSEKIPPASNFYLSYICLQGLTIPSGLLLQLVALILAQFLGKILDSTPRAKWNRWNILGSPLWSVVYPAYQLIIVIALVYAIIAPLILGFSAVAFLFIYFAFLYQLVYVLQPSKNDARGSNYVNGLSQMFVGLYLAELCLIAMFVFTKNWACVALEAVIMAFSVAVHLYIRFKLYPLLTVVPISALRYADGDKAYEYPMHDQGLKEIQTEGKNYWQGGNQLGLQAPLAHEHTDVETNPAGDDYSRAQLGDELHTSDLNKPINQLLDEKLSNLNESNLNEDYEKSPSKPITPQTVAKAPAGWIKRFF